MGKKRNMIVLNRLSANENSTFANSAAGKWFLWFVLAAYVYFLAKVLPTFSRHCHEPFDCDLSSGQIEVGNSNCSLSLANHRLCRQHAFTSIYIGLY